MGCPESLEALRAIGRSLKRLEDEMTEKNIDQPSNRLTVIADGWTEDIKRFSVGDGWQRWQLLT